MSNYIEIPVDDDASLVRDNARLITATTMLSLLKQEDNTYLDGFTESHIKNRTIRLLSALAFILPRSNDITVTVMAKMVPGKVQVLVANEQSGEVDNMQRSEDFYSGDNHDYMLPEIDDISQPGDKNNNSRPRVNNPRRLALEHVPKQADDFNVWTDLCHHLKENTATFFHHATTIMHLLNITLQPHGNINILVRYCTTRQTAKLQQRLRSGPLELLRATMKGAGVSDFRPVAESFPAFDNLDKKFMSHISLSPDTPDAQCTMFFEIWHFISEKLETIQTHLSTLKVMSHSDFSMNSERHRTALAELVFTLETVRHISWGSDFFSWFLNEYLPRIILERRAKLKNSGGETLLFTGHSPIYEKDEAYEHQVMTQDIENELPKDNGNIGPIQKALRLVSSLLHHTRKIIMNKHLAGQQVDFSVLTYSHPKEPEVGDWKDTIIRLFSETNSDIVDKVRPIFDPSGPIARTASVHCEALLGALRWRLCDMPSTPGIPAQSFFQEAYPLLAVSKRCCPACAIILSLLNKSEPPPKLGLYAKHPVILPCVFPPYLPKSTRDAVIKHFEDLLVDTIKKHVAPRRDNYETQSDPSDSSSSEEDSEERYMERFTSTW